MSSPASPLRIGVIGGTGLEEALTAEGGEVHEIDMPFGKPSSPIVRTQWEGVEIALLQRHGPGHMLGPAAVPYRANIFALKSLEVTHILASGAAGSLREHIAPGDLVLVDQIIDRTWSRPGTFYERAAVHVEMSEPCCPVMRRWLLRAAAAVGEVVGPHGGGGPAEQAEADVGRVADERDQSGSGRAGGGVVRIHDGGTYVCMEGPAFSTRAESHLHRRWGGDLIGMTAMPEAKLAREAEIAYALIAAPTDYDCWRAHEAARPQQALLAEIADNLRNATGNTLALIQTALRDVQSLEQTPSPAHSALDLAIWSKKSAIDEAEVERLHTLWGRCFVSG